MTDTTRDMLTERLEYTGEKIRQLVTALEEGREYYSEGTGETCDDPDEFGVTHAWTSDRIDDWRDLHEVLDEYPLAVTDERGKPFAIVLTTGGPHIEVSAEGLGSASLHGYWGGEHVIRSGSHFSAFLDYYIDRED